jgi:hypothetical protein
MMRKNLRHLGGAVAVAVALAASTFSPSALASDTRFTPGADQELSRSVSAAPATRDRLTCRGYAERRQFVDAQSWWLNDPGRGFHGDERGHTHLGACIPDHENITGVIPLDLRIILHDNSGRLRYVSVVFKTAATEKTVAVQRPSLTCNGGVGTCTFWFHFDVGATKFPVSGLEEIRFRANVKEISSRGISEEMRPSMGFLVNVRNGKSVSRYPWLRGKGWYTGAKYCEASLISTLPDAPVSGVWRPTVIMDDHDGGHAGDAKATHHVATLDPDFHAPKPVLGTVINQGNDGLPATRLRIDTTKLTNGPHKLHLRTDCDVPARGSVNSGVLVVPFAVAN